MVQTCMVQTFHNSASIQFFPNIISISRDVVTSFAAHRIFAFMRFRSIAGHRIALARVDKLRIHTKYLFSYDILRYY